MSSRRVSAISLLIWSANAWATCPAEAPFDLMVDDDGPADFSSIQDAINAAGPGSRIRVRCGSYVEATSRQNPLGTFVEGAVLYVDRALTLVGEQLGCVVVHQGSLTGHRQSASILIGPGVWDADLRNLVLFNDQPGTNIAPWGETHTYTAIADSDLRLPGGALDVRSGTLRVRNTIFSLTLDHAKSIVYTNHRDGIVDLDHVVVDFGRRQAGGATTTSSGGPG